MKRILSVILIMLMSITVLTACGSSDQGEVLDGFTIDADTDNEDVKSEFDEYLNSLA